MNIKLSYLILILFLSGCASQSPLTGGDRDFSPPILTHVYPSQQSVNIKPKQIDFEFNEYIQNRSLLQKLIVSPPLKNTPLIKQKPKGFSLIINDTLLNNTTYQFYFADAIVDLNEGNPVVDFTYVFSTGKFIDSISVSGKILDAYTNKPEALFSVCLYSDTSDSVVFKQHPSYICKTNNEGFFKFNYLKSGYYKLVAFNDKNNNYRFDPSSEKIAFFDTIISINKNIDSLLLYSFQENRTKQYIKKTERKKQHQALIVFNQSSYYKPSITQSSVPIYQITYSENNDSLQVFFTDSTKYSNDTIQVQIQYTRYDSLLQKHTINEQKNLIYVPTRTKEITTANTSFKVSINNNQTISSTHNLYIHFTEPTHLSKQHIKFFIHLKDTLYENIPFRLIQSENQPLKYFIETKLIDGRKYRLVLNFDTLTSFYETSYKNDTIDFMTYEKEEFGCLHLFYNLPQNDMLYIFELLNEKNNIVFHWTDSLSNHKKITYLLPGKYTLRCTEDKNLNLRWDSGFYILKKQPEKTYIYPQTFQLRANWDLELKWDVSD